MKYSNVVQGKFISRPNRFIAHVLVNGVLQVCHVKNTGRCKELFENSPTVYLEESTNPLRKTKYDVIAVKKGELLINIDSVAPNYAVAEFFKEEFPNLKREVAYKSSRFDIFTGNGFIEVKGVTLEKDGIAMFPDAPTKRGVKHINELIEIKNEGMNAAIIFVIQFEGAKCFIPNYKTDPEFKNALLRAQKAGVSIRAFDCRVTPCEMVINNEVPVCLDMSLPTF